MHSTFTFRNSERQLANLKNGRTLTRQLSTENSNSPRLTLRGNREAEPMTAPLGVRASQIFASLEAQLAVGDEGVEEVGAALRHSQCVAGLAREGV